MSGSIAFLAVICLLSACARTAPTRVDMDQVLSDPKPYNKQRLELRGRVIDFEPAQGDTYRTLHFTLGLGPQEKIPVFASGHTVDSIEKASILIGEAYSEKGLVTVIGRLKAYDGAAPAAVELELETVEYSGRIIDVTKGRQTQPGFDAGGIRIVPSIGVGVILTP